MIDISKLAKEAIAFGLKPQIVANAQITFSQSTGEVLEFDEIGNPIIIPADKTPFVIDCYLWQPKDSKNQKNEAGVDVLSNYYIGRLVNPKTYTFPIRADGEINITLNGRQGRLIELMQLETAFSNEVELPNNLGQKIQCYIEFSEGN
jgi:hypothetical protein